MFKGNMCFSVTITKQVEIDVSDIDTDDLSVYEDLQQRYMKQLKEEHSKKNPKDQVKVSYISMSLRRN